MIKPDLISRSKRKTISIVITSDAKVLVKAPLKISLNEINKFVYEKQNWIESKLNIITQNRSQFDDVINYKKMLILGIKYDIYKSDNVKKIALESDKLIVPSKYTNEKILEIVKKWYINFANEIISNRYEEISKHIKLKGKEVLINNTRGRWGACTSKGRITFNFRIVMLPPKLIDYVIIHELCHLVEMNHSTKFWNLVSLFMPDFLQVRRQMKTYNFLLKLF